jgi:cobalt-zinc-cadmium efflux system outer membrane protein
VFFSLLQLSVANLFAQSAASPAHVGGSTTPPATEAIALRPLQLDEALVLAEQNSPQLSEADASVNRAQAGVQTARAYTNPSVEFLGGHQSARPISTPGVPGSSWRYAASQTVEIPRERRTRLKTAQLDLIGNGFRRSGVQLSVEADVKRAFFDVIRRKQQLAHAKDNLALVEDLRRRVRLEVEVGEKGKLELTRAEAEMARAQAAVRNADVQLANARAILKVAIGVSSDDVFDAEGALSSVVTLAPLSELRPQVLLNHPALSEAQTLTARSTAAVENQRAKRIPTPTFAGEYERQPDVTYYRFGVNIPLPLWDKRKGQIAEAQAEVSRSQALGRQRQLEVTSALERAYDQYKISNQQVEGLEAGSLREAEAAVEAARNAYKFGERGIVEVLDAQRVLQGVRSDLLDAMSARQSALIDLEELGVKHQ